MTLRTITYEDTHVVALSFFFFVNTHPSAANHALHLSCGEKFVYPDKNAERKTLHKPSISMLDVSNQEQSCYFCVYFYTWSPYVCCTKQPDILSAVSIPLNVACIHSRHSFHVVTKHVNVFFTLNVIISLLF